MNNPNPFVPKGSLLEQQSQRRSRLKLTVFLVLAASVSCLVVMLIQGCKREAPEALSTDTNTPALDTNLPPALDTNLPPPLPPATNAAVLPPPVAPLVTPPPVVPAAPAAGTEYTIVSGDTLAKIAKKNGVTVKAIEDANPGVDPKKLRPGKKLIIPASTASAAPAAPGALTAMDTGSEKTYVVKSGDTLSKIAKRNGVTLKALRAANNLTTDHIKVGDKLKIPAKIETASAPAPAPDTSAPPALPPAPTPVAPTPTPATGH